MPSNAIRGNNSSRLILAGSALAVFVAASYFAPPASAQVFPGPQQVDPTQSDLYGKDNTAGVYVRDSAIALEKLAHAQHMEQLKEWNTSADLYQEILEKYPDRVVPAGVDAADQVIQYTSVTEAVREALCKWPPDGLDVYRGRYETTAANLLASVKPGDLATLHKIVSMYFPTDTAKQAALRLMDSYFELGDYAAVAQIGRRLLDWHPNLVAERPEVLYRVAIAEQLTGDSASAQNRLSELHRRFAQATGTVRGSDVVLADALAKDLSSDVKIVMGAESDSWTMLGGNPSRNKISSSLVKPGAKLYDIPLIQPNSGQNLDANTRAQLDSLSSQMRENGSSMGVMPAVDQNQLFFQDNTRIYAVNLDSGVPLAGWAGSYPQENGQYRLPQQSTPLPPGQQLCVTITDRYVIAVMGLPDHVSAFANGFQQGLAQNGTRLVCLSRANGKEVWNISLEQLPEDQNALRDLQLGGSPLVVGDNLFIIGHGGKGQQFEDCYALCFDVNTGKLRWNSYIASANSDAALTDPNTGQAIISDAVSHIAYASGRLFVITNLGAVAALDAYSGTVVWLNIYRDSTDQISSNGNFAFRGFRGRFAGNQQLMPTATQPWLYNPAIVENGHVFVFPHDSRSMFIYDAAGGKLIKRLYMTDFTPDTDSSQPQTLLAVDDDMLILGGPNRVWRVPWRLYDHDTQTKPRGFWVSSPTVSPPGDSTTDTVRGLSFVTGDAVYIPTLYTLQRVELKTGKVIGNFPPNNWDASTQGPGNVLVTADHLIIAGDKRVDVYTDLEMARAKLDRAITADPTDPDARLHYAEVMFVAGQTDVAEQRLDEAIGLLGGIDHLRPGDSRDRAFNDAMNFATKLSAKGADPAMINRFFDRAGAAAGNPSQQVAYRVGRIKFDQTRGDDAAVITRYQEILASDTMRLVVVPDPQSGAASQAAIVAEKAIGLLLETTAGKTAYAPFEKAARAKFAEAQNAGNPDVLLAIAKDYPNAQVAADAMLAAADAYESASQWRQATMVLRQLLNKHHDSTRAPLLEAMTRNYLKIPGCFDIAVSRMALAATATPNARLIKPLTLPDGTLLQNISYKDAHDALVGYNTKVSTDLLPDFHLPNSAQRTAYAQTHPGGRIAPFAPESADLRIPNVGALLSSLDGFDRPDRIATWTSKLGLSIYAVGKTTPLATCADVASAPTGSAWTNGGLVVWSNHALDFIDPDSGNSKWAVAVEKLPNIGVIADTSPPANPNTNNGQNGAGNVIAGNGALIINGANGPAQVIIQPGGLIIRNGVVIGRMGVQPQQAMPPAPPVVTGDEQIQDVVPISDQMIVTTTTGRILAVDGTDGKIAWQTRLSDRAVTRIVANEDFTVVRTQDDTAVQLVVLNSFNGELVGRKSFPIGGDVIPSFPVNMALSADGMLVYTLPDRLCIQDLFEAGNGDNGMEPKFSSPATPETAQLFLVSNQPNQLIAAQGRVFAVANHGKEIRIYSLDTGQPWQYHNADANGNVPGVLTTGLSNAVVQLKITGDYLYVKSPQTIAGFQLDNPANSWPGHKDTSANYIQTLFGKDDLIVVNRPNKPLSQGGGPGKRITLDIFSRERLKNNRENGMQAFNPDLSDPAGVTDIRAVEGGIVYLTGDGVLHTLFGAQTN